LQTLVILRPCPSGDQSPSLNKNDTTQTLVRVYTLNNLAIGMTATFDGEYADFTPINKSYLVFVCGIRCFKL